MQWVLIIGFVAMSAVIASFGDTVGKNLGKKRLSIFGLRPRHTAKLGTILVGVFISIFSIVAIMIVSAGVREWIVKGPAIAKHLDEAIQARDIAIRDIKGLKNDAKAVAQHNNQLTLQMKQSSADLAKRQSELTTAKNELSQLQTRIDRLQPKIRDLTSKVNTGNLKIKELNTSQQKLQSANAKGQLNLQKVIDEQKIAKVSLQSISANNSDISKRNLDLYNLNENLEKEKARIQAELKGIQVETAKVRTEHDEILGKLVVSQNELQAAQNELGQVNAKLALAQQEVESSSINETKLYGISKVSRNEPMIYRIGEEVARISVPSGLSVNSAKGELRSLLRKSRVEAEKRGARGKLQYPAAGIFEHTGKTPEEVVSPESIESQLAIQVASGKEPKVLIAYSSLNAFLGEPVSLEVSVMSNPAVYSQGQIIAETLVDANKGDKVIYEQLVAFMQKDVKERAQRDGLIPIANSDYSFGQITLPEVLQVMDRLKKVERRVRLQALAAYNTRAADTLKIQFQLR